jgi:hypothetical protein
MILDTADGKKFYNKIIFVLIDAARALPKWVAAAASTIFCTKVM